MTRPKKIAVYLALGVAAVLAVVITVLVIQRRTAPVSPVQFVPTTWETARTTPMHEAHIGAAKVACVTCHVEGYAAPPAEAVCATCHAKAAQHAHRGDAKAPTTCMTCHAFAAGKKEATCVGCHGPIAPGNGGAGGSAEKDRREGSEAARTAHALARHVSKEAACNACHDVHGDKAAKTRTVLGDCNACHTSVSASHGRVATAAGPKHDGDAGLSFDAAVARFAADSRVATSLRDAGATSVAQVCAACHAPHTAAGAARDSCATCHVGGAGARVRAPDAKQGESMILTAQFAPRIEPRGRNVAGHDACVTCHEPHRAEKAAARQCQDCHGDHRAATTVAGHAECTGCHTPHAPSEAKASCANAGCHAGKTALAAPRVAAHTACASCHDPHKPAASPALSCVKCHSGVEPKHPPVASKTAGASTCIGCHAPHGANANAKVAANAKVSANGTATACSSCHTKAKNERAFHAGGVACTTCHKPHELAANLLRNAAGGHAHGVPAPAAKGEEAALCASCHALQTKAVAARPGHGECGVCHGDVHSPVKKPACAKCHAQETASAPRGHAVCTQCHDSHSGSLGANAACATCHAEKTKQPHGALPGTAGSAGSCASCHTPHGPKGVLTPPPCVSCHAKPKLEGLHSITAHNTSCASCHSSHAAPRSDRATCTSSCHVVRRDHQPEAKVCKGCHMFRK